MEAKGVLTNQSYQNRKNPAPSVSTRHNCAEKRLEIGASPLRHVRIRGQELVKRG